MSPNCYSHGRIWTYRNDGSTHEQLIVVDVGSPWQSQSIHWWLRVNAFCSFRLIKQPWEHRSSHWPAWVIITNHHCLFHPANCACSQLLPASDSNTNHQQKPSPPLKKLRASTPEWVYTISLVPKLAALELNLSYVLTLKSVFTCFQVYLLTILTSLYVLWKSYWSL